MAEKKNTTDSLCILAEKKESFVWLLSPESLMKWKNLYLTSHFYLIESEDLIYANTKIFNVYHSLLGIFQSEIQRNTELTRWSGELLEKFI